MLTKGDIIKAAFEEIGLGAAAYSLRPEDIQSALLQLNRMMGQWAGAGLVTGYQLAATKEQDSANLLSGLSDYAEEAVAASLAMRIAPDFGKSVSPETRVAAREGKRLITRLSTTPPAKIIDYTAAPLGAGHRHQVVTITPEEVAQPVQTVDDDDIFGGDIVVVPE